MSGPELSLIVTTVAAVLLLPVLKLRSALRGLAGSALILVSALSPLIFEPDESGFVRLGVAIVIGIVSMKMVDALVGASRGHRFSALSYLSYLVNPGSLVFRRVDREPRRDLRRDPARLLRGLAQMGVGIVLLEGFFLIEWSTLSFWAEHTIKMAGFFVGVLGMFETITTLARLVGFRSRLADSNPLRSTTPADFWRRYNRVVQQFFFENVFRVANGRRYPALATLLVFAISGAIHEYVFSVSAGHFQGYQLVFFLVQGVGVVLTARTKLPAVLRPLGAVLTLGFLVASGVFFMASLDQIIPIYVNPVPSLLRGW